MVPENEFDIDTLLDEVVTLPSLPDSVTKLTEMLDDPSCDMKDVAAVISSDPAIALKTLRLVNSAYYGLGQEVTSVDHATVLLGAKVLKNLAMTATAFDCMKASAADFLTHSVACGLAMKSLVLSGCIKGFVGSEDEAFTYGLIHDIGKIILEEYLPDECAEVGALVEDEGIPWYKAEQQVIGVDHAELGARLAQKWKLTSAVVNAIRGHHDLSMCAEEHRTLAASLSIANQLCGLSGYAAHPKNLLDIDPEMYVAADIKPDALPGVTNLYFDMRSSLDELLTLAD
ncbi:MAG: HDOD domain-containing protein [Candidatus Hydrogenedentes bacterium]|nr:HDOD domain-containing protein [Candidatus Hydrogenedentota bacterium]